MGNLVSCAMWLQHFEIPYSSLAYNWYLKQSERAARQNVNGPRLKNRCRSPGIWTFFSYVATYCNDTRCNLVLGTGILLASGGKESWQ